MSENTTDTDDARTSSYFLWRQLQLGCAAMEKNNHVLPEEHALEILVKFFGWCRAYSSDDTWLRVVDAAQLFYAADYFELTHKQTDKGDAA